jgi:hypothetical protein
MSKEELLQQIKIDRRQLERYLFDFEKDEYGEFVPISRLRFTKREMQQPGVIDDWSVKDILANLSGWEMHFIKWHQTNLGGESRSEDKLWETADKFNEKIYESNRERPFEDVLEDFHKSHRDLLNMVVLISEEELTTENLFPLTGCHNLGEFINMVTWEHYRWAKKFIRRWSKTHDGKRRDKNGVLQSIETERRRLESNLASLSNEEMTEPGVIGDWSVKDILAHLVDWEQRFLGWYQAGLRGEVPETPAPGLTWNDLDELNRRIYEQNRERSLQSVMQEFNRSYNQVLETVNAIPEEDIFPVGRYTWTGKGNLAGYILANTANHYRWAKTGIRKWLRE